MRWTWPRFERRTALVMLAAFTVFGLWQGNTVWLAMQVDGDEVPGSRPYFWELSGVLCVYVWSWIPIATAKNAPRPGRRWARFFGIHAGGYVVFAALHTATLLGSRMVLYPLLGWGSYRYSGSEFRIPMDWHKMLLAYVVLAVGYGLISSWRENQRRALRDAQLATELRDAQLRALVGQLNPHFLFNALNTISAVMYVDLARTDRLLADLGGLLRASLAGDAGPTWSLDEERAYTERFLAVMLARFGDRLSVEWRVDEGAGAIQVPRFTLQLLVENAIKHNQDALTPLAIGISARRHDDRIEVVVEDNGRGFGPSSGTSTSTSTGTGTGLATLRQALALCHGPATALVLERGAQGGARVRLTMPAEAAA
jgi:hypothetical protein